MPDKRCNHLLAGGNHFYHPGGGKWLNKDTKVLEKYEEYLSETELSKSTKEIYYRQAKVFLTFMGERPINKKEMIAYKKYLTEKGYAGATVNLYIVASNHFIKSMGYEDYSIRTERLQKRGCPENILDKEEYIKMLDYAKESGRMKYYYLMRTLALTGIRISELADCTVEALSYGKFHTSNKGKTREIYLPDKLVRELTAYCADKNIVSGAIFKGNTDKAINRISVYQMLVRLADMTGVPKEKVHPHSFRHLFAVTYMEQYSNLFELADILGHSSLETTRVYTATTGEAKRRKMDKLNL
jgi:integrase